MRARTAALLLGRGALALDAVVEAGLRHGRLPWSAAAWSRSISTTSMPAWAATVAMPAPIMPAPRTPSFLHALVGAGGADGALLQRLLVEEERADHRRGGGVHQHAGEPARLDAERGVEGDERALVDGREHRLGGGVGALGPAVDHRRGADEGHEARRVVGRAAGELVALGVPGLDDVGVGRRPAPRPCAAARRSSGGTTSSIRPAALAAAGASILPSSRRGAAAIRPSMRTRRVVPPAPGKMPMRISGRPMRAFGRVGHEAAVAGEADLGADAGGEAGGGPGDGLAALERLRVHAGALDLPQQAVHRHDAVEEAAGGVGAGLLLHVRPGG